MFRQTFKIAKNDCIDGHLNSPPPRSPSLHTHTSCHVIPLLVFFLALCIYSTQADDAFNMCSSFKPCLNNGVCDTSGGYQFTCTCPAGFSGMVCEDSEADFANTLAPDDGTANPAGGTSGSNSRGSSSEPPVEDDPFRGVFVGEELTAANAMVISIGVLIVSVIVSAVVLYVSCPTFAATWASVLHVAPAADASRSCN